MTLLVGGCSDEVEQEPQDVDFCVRAAWQDGLGGGRSARALTATDILASGTGDIAIATADYPTIINVHCSDGKDFALDKGTAVCRDHGGYWQYTASAIYKDKKIERDDLTFSFKAVIDEDGNPLTTNDGDRLVGETDKNCITEKTSTGQRHMLVTLHHTKALLRFAFKVSEKYDKVRFIRVTGIRLNGEEGVVVDKVLNKDGMTFVGYAYIDPTVVTTTYENTIQCTYNIYDKDAATDAHLTRKGVVAQNKFKLGSLKDKSDNLVTQIQPGYYYDLNVTLNPDYLYVLAEHDNKHITIE